MRTSLYILALYFTMLSISVSTFRVFSESLLDLKISEFKMECEDIDEEDNQEKETEKEKEKEKEKEAKEDYFATSHFNRHLSSLYKSRSFKRTSEFPLKDYISEIITPPPEA